MLSAGRSSHRWRIDDVGEAGVAHSWRRRRAIRIREPDNRRYSAELRGIGQALMKSSPAAILAG